MPMELHNHSYRGVTSFNDGHRHRYAGKTTSDPDVPGHIHYMAGYTTFDDGHTHYYAIETGPEVNTREGHYHLYRGVTRVADRHVHFFQGRTSIYTG